MKRALAFILVTFMALVLLPGAVFGAEQEESRRVISVLGDSISTYSGYSNGVAAEATNSTIKNGAVYYPRSGFDVTPESTWWHQAAEALGMDILVNNSWSGSCLLNTRSGTVGAYVDRCVQLHDDTGENAGQTPDLIAIFLGTNDYYTYPGTLGSFEAIDFDSLIAATDSGVTYGTPSTSLEAYAIILDKISHAYPQAEVYCFTLLPRVNSTSQPTAFNEDIVQLAKHYGASVVDLYHCGISSETGAFNLHMGDNLHPDDPGMDAISNAFVSAVLKNEDAPGYDVSFELDQVVAMEGTTRRVVVGESFRTQLVGLIQGRPLEVQVQMDGVDITASCYADGMVRIPSVTGAVEITAAMAEASARSFYWHFDSRTDSLVSLSTCGNTENPLTMTAGSITDGKFSKVKYTLNEALVLKHNRPWVLQWRSSGTWTDTTDGALLFAGAASSTTENAPYLYRRHNSDFIAFGVRSGGQYHNYGVALKANGIDGTQPHTYRLENRLAEDGSNMVYLLVDGQELGPMNHHWVGGTDKKETVDWLNGQDLVFSYMGTNPHTIGNCYIDYILAQESGHSHRYHKGICKDCGAELPVVQGLCQTVQQENALGISWEALPDATKYWVYVNGGIYASTTNTELTVTKRTPGTTYEIAVTALLKDGTVLPLQKAQVLAAQTLEQAKTEYTADTNSISLTWAAEGSTKTWIYLGTSEDQLKPVASTTGTQYTLTKLKSNTCYYLRLSRLIDGRVVTSQEILEVQTASDGALRVEAQLDETGLNLSWKSYGDSYKYWVICRNGDKTLTYSTTDTNFRLTGLDLSQWQVSVRGVNSQKVYDYEPFS